MAREPRFPSPTQEACLLLDNEHVLFGGAAGGGKSSLVLGAALQYVDVPGYSAGIFRRKYTDLQQPDALIPRSHEWLAGTRAHWQGDKVQWVFPSGATLKFGYLDGGNDHLNYQGAAFQYVGFDEAGQLRPTQMQFMQTRARRLDGSPVPIRFRYSANPGGEAHDWLVQNFILEGPQKGWVFIPSLARDNPGLDVADYLRRLDAITDPVLRAQMRDGDWGAVDRSGLIVPEFDSEVEAAVVAVLERPEYFTAYEGVDIGSRDLTVDLFAHLDFVGGYLYVEDERVWRDPNTTQLGDTITATEEALWGEARKAGRVDATLRYCDVDWRFVKDLNAAPYKLPFIPTAKQEAEVWERACRTSLASGRIRIHPRCQTLIRTLKHARWNERRTDYERTPETGHADAWKALVYLHRNVQWDRNPFPRVTLQRGQLVTSAPLSNTARNMGRAFKGGVRPLK